MAPCAARVRQRAAHEEIRVDVADGFLILEVFSRHANAHATDRRAHFDGTVVEEPIPVRRGRSRTRRGGWRALSHRSRARLARRVRPVGTSSRLHAQLAHRIGVERAATHCAEQLRGWQRARVRVGKVSEQPPASR
jgi:hypothetical protein